MRLIRKKLVADSILGYWKNIAVLKGISERLDEVGSYRSTVSAQLFHNKYFVLDTSVSVFATGVSENPRLIRNDPALIAEYSNRTFSRKRILNNYILYMGWTKFRAVRLIKLIRDQYHIREN